MDLYDKLDRAVTKAFQPNALDKIIVGIAKPIEAGKLEDSLIVELNDRIYRKQTSLPKKFYWEIFIILALGFVAVLYGLFSEYDNIFIRIIGVIISIAICIGGGFFLYFLIESLS